MFNPYDILGVKKNSSEEEIKKAYKDLAKIWHPDKDTGNKDRFQSINDAYECLVDKEKRKWYDEFGYIKNSKEEKEFDTALEKISVLSTNIYLNLKTQNKSFGNIDFVKELLKICRQDIITLDKQIDELEKIKPNLLEFLNLTKNKLKKKKSGKIVPAILINKIQVGYEQISERIKNFEQEKDKVFLLMDIVNGFSWDNKESAIEKLSFWSKQ